MTSKMIEQSSHKKPEHAAPWVQIAVAAIGAIAVIWPAYLTVRGQQLSAKVDSTQNDLRASGVGSLERGQKLCRVLQGKTWRDGLIVPQNWTISLCADYMLKTGGSDYQLGCIYTSGTTLADLPKAVPSPNCGWQ